MLAPLLFGCADAAPTTAVHWRFDSTKQVDGLDATILGAPRIASDRGRSYLEFDGVDDALVLPLHPLTGAGAFTAEIVFRPDAGGEAEQRFLHLQEEASEDRILVELRLRGEEWFLDTYVKSDGRGHTLYAKGHRHPVGSWYHAALVVDGGEMRHYVNGRLELSRPIRFRPQGPGRTSLGVRINGVSWFRGAIRETRFTPRALRPEAFLPL